MAGVLYSLAMFYGIFILKEVPPKKPTKMDEAAQQTPTEKKSLIADFFDLAHVRETFRLAFKSGEKNRRSKIIMLMLVAIIVVGPQHGMCHLLQRHLNWFLLDPFTFYRNRTGEMSLFYLFTRYKFNWSEVEFSFFSTYSMGIHLIGKYCPWFHFRFVLSASLTTHFSHRHGIFGEHIF